jgi:hypothetical protein
MKFSLELHQTNQAHNKKPTTKQGDEDELSFFVIALVEDWSATITNDRERSRKS